MSVSNFVRGARAIDARTIDKVLGKSKAQSLLVTLLSKCSRRKSGFVPLTLSEIARKVKLIDEEFAIFESVRHNTRPRSLV